MGFISRLFSYDGAMEFKELNDNVVTAGYQHKFIVERYIDRIRKRRVLDAGCWTGPIEKEIASRGIDVELVGIDENQKALMVAAKNFSNFKFIQLELTDPPGHFIDNYAGYFDTIIFLDVIEHLPKGSELRALNFFYNILKRDGVIIISTMADNIFNFIDPGWFLGHRHYKLAKLANMLEAGGFQIKETLPIGNAYWDIDLLLFYICKHILRKGYKTSEGMHKRIMRGFDNPRVATRFYLVVKKLEKRV